MFDYFNRLKKNNFEGKESQEKSKDDKRFIAVIAFCTVIVIINFVVGIADVGSVQNTVLDFKLNISDVIILGTILLAYLISKIREEQK